MMNVQKAESIGDFIKNALKDSSHTVIPNISAAKGNLACGAKPKYDVLRL